LLLAINPCSIHINFISSIGKKYFIPPQFKYKTYYMKAEAERRVANLKSNYKWLLVGFTTDKFYCISHFLIYKPLKLFKNLAPKI